MVGVQVHPHPQSFLDGQITISQSQLPHRVVGTKKKGRKCKHNPEIFGGKTVEKCEKRINLCRIYT